MRRKYLRAQVSAKLEFGKREKQIGAPDEHGAVDADVDALPLYQDMLSAGLTRAADNMLKRHRKQYTDSRICPDGPHLKGTKFRGYFHRSDFALGPGTKECFACYRHKRNLARAEAGKSGRAAIPLAFRRVQQTQHLPEAVKFERSERRRAKFGYTVDNYPWVQSCSGRTKGKWVLKKSWRHLAKKLKNPHGGIGSRTYTLVAEHNKPIIAAELARRKSNKQ